MRSIESRQFNGGQQDAHGQDVLVQRLVKLGIGEDAAKEMVDVQREAARQERRVLDEKVHGYEIDSWHSDLERKHKDYREMFPAMEKAFAALSPQAQLLAVSGPDALELLYKGVKADTADRKAQESFNAGANSAYQNKALKQAGSSIPGQGNGGGPQKLTPAAIGAMSDAEYKRRLPEINDAISNRTLKRQ